MSKPIARILSSRNSLLQNTSFDEIGRLFDKSFTVSSDRFILSSNGAYLLKFPLIFVLPLILSKVGVNVAVVLTEEKARDCSASSSDESTSYEDDSLPSVEENSLLEKGIRDDNILL